MIEHTFAATYELTLVDQREQKYQGTRAPGEWLKPARLSRTSGANL